MFEENDIIDKLQQFLVKSANRYSEDVGRYINDLEAFQGNFWTDDVKKKYKRTAKNKFCLHFSDWSVLCNAIASPISNSPWHINILNKLQYNEVQNAINQMEQDNDAKYELKKAFHRAVACGAGFIVVTTDLDEVTGEPKIVLEFVNRQDSIALDPNIERADGSDAEEGAIVNYISISKAKRLYGSDVLPFDYPRAIPKLSFLNIGQWPMKEDQVQIVSYYRKNENGLVEYYKVCGNKVVESMELPINYIPIVRFAGYDKYNGKYGGIVDKTWTLQLGLNIAYSTLMERANRSIKANVIASTKAVENLTEYYKKKEDEDGSMILFNEGATPPTTLVEQFQTADLQAVIQTTRETIADVIGIPLSGLLGSEDKTATEILIQQNNKESNVATLYDNAYKANRTIGRIIIELLTGGMNLSFDLENGPDIITSNLKHRQELTAIAQLMPPEMQPLVAVHMCDTIDSDFVEGVRNDIIANLGQNLKIVSDKPTDPVAIHELEQMKTVLDQSMAQLEMLQQQNQDLKLQNAQLSLSLNNAKEKNMLEWAKHQDQMTLDEAKINLEAEKQGVELNLDITKAQNDVMKTAVDIEQKKLNLVEDAMNTENKEVE